MGSLHAIALSVDRKIWIITNRDLLTIIGQWTIVSDASLLVLHVSDQETCREAVGNSPTDISAYAAKHREWCLLLALHVSDQEPCREAFVCHHTRCKAMFETPGELAHHVRDCWDKQGWVVIFLSVCPSFDQKSVGVQMPLLLKKKADNWWMLREWQCSTRMKPGWWPSTFSSSLFVIAFIL